MHTWWRKNVKSQEVTAAFAEKFLVIRLPIRRAVHSIIAVFQGTGSVAGQDQLDQKKTYKQQHQSSFIILTYQQENWKRNSISYT